jgi:septal ring factor EnvC (AmiA/AmiB activator)
MSPDIVAALVSLLLSLLTTYVNRQLARRARQRELATTGELPKFRDRMQKLSEELARASAEVDKTLDEMAMVSQVREQALKGLETKLDELTQREEELQARVAMLKDVPLPAAEYFLEVTAKGEERSATRDYVLFGAGVVVSTVITIILRLVFNI